jgi:type II secretion system protein D
MRMIRATIVSAATLLPLALASPAAAQDVTIGENTITLQFDEVSGTPMLDFIKLCQDLTGHQLNYDNREVEEVRLRFVGRKEIRREEFWSYFQAVLKAYKFVLVSYGPLDQVNDPEAPGFYSIMPVSGAAGQRAGQIKSQAPVVSVVELETFKNDPNIVLTTSYALRYVSSQDAMNMLQIYFADPLLESVRAVSNSNTLVVTGFAQTLWGVKQLLALIDVQPEEYQPQFAKIELEFAVAEEIKAIVDQLIAAERGQAPGRAGAAVQPGTGLPPHLQEPEPHIEADPRTNALLVVAAPGTLETIINYIRVLDVEVDPRGDTHVYRLKNSAALELEEILTKWAESAGQATASGAQPGAATSGTASSGTLEQPVTVVADEASNSLIITASRSRYAQVLEIVKKLDVRRRQVLIESAVVEISGTLNDVLGVELGYVNAPGSDSDRTGFGVTSFGLSTLEDTNGDGFVDFRVPLGLEPGTTGSPGVTAGIFKGDDFEVPVLIAALKTTTDANVLAMPSTLVNDNEEAVIQSLDEIPTFSTSQGVNSDQTSFDEFQEAGITLNISPSISAGNYLRLLVRVEVSTFTSPEGNPPPKATRQVETEVTLPDGHTMVIGGIVSADERNQTRKVPWLGDLPLVGWLFRATSDQSNTVNLYIFITPHIISDDFSTLDELSYLKKKEAEALNGKIHLVDPDWDRENADTILLDAGVSGVFALPSYAPPESGEPPVTPDQAPAPEPAPAESPAETEEPFEYGDGDSE